MNDRELVTFIKSADQSKEEYSIACGVLLEKYKNLIHRNWWILQKQMNNSDLVNTYKEDFYSNAYITFFTALEKTNLDVIRDDKWKFVGMFGWYLINLRKKTIENLMDDSKLKSLSHMNTMEDEDSNIVDSDIEESYQFTDGYKQDPSFICERKESEKICKEAIKECYRKWTEKEKTVYNMLVKGDTRCTISKELNLPMSRIYLISRKMKNDLKQAMGYTN